MLEDIFFHTFAGTFILGCIWSASVLVLVTIRALVLLAEGLAVTDPHCWVFIVATVITVLFAGYFAGEVISK